MMTKLLAKFPDYDPAWGEEQVHLWRGSLAFLMAEVTAILAPPRTAQLTRLALRHYMPWANP